MRLVHGTQGANFNQNLFRNYWSANLWRVQREASTVQPFVTFSVLSVEFINPSHIFVSMRQRECISRGSRGLEASEAPARTARKRSL